MDWSRQIESSPSCRRDVPVRSSGSWSRSIPLWLLEAALVVTWSSCFAGARYSIGYAPALLVVFWRCALLTVLLFPAALPGMRKSALRACLKQAGIGALA
jgi:hypothetical protein